MSSKDKQRIICAILMAVALVLILITAIWIHGDNKRKEAEINRQIKESALEQIGLSSDAECELAFTGRWEEVKWSDCYIYIYTLRIEESIYLVGAKRKDWGLYGVKVECKLTEQEAEEWEIKIS